MFNTYIKGVNRTSEVRMIDTLDSGEKVIHLKGGSIEKHAAKDVWVIARVFDSNNKDAGE